MKQGHLSQYFIGVGAKTLRGTEVDPKISHGHELQGIEDFRIFLGTPEEKQKIPVKYVWLTDEIAPLEMELEGTWYDARREKKVSRTPEFRLYYPVKAEEIIHKAKAGDTLFLCLPKEGNLTAIFCPSGSTIETQLLWLFGLKLQEDFKFAQRDFREERGHALDVTARTVLDLIGTDVIVPDEGFLEKILKKFGERFPTTAEFSEFARVTAAEVSPVEDPDTALMTWIDHEEKLFRILEKYMVGKRLQDGFLIGDNPDVEGFIQYSLSVQNRRKSRAGYALENHLEVVFSKKELRYSRTEITENKSKPDFLFPGGKEYHDQKFNPLNLTMLGVKSTCKDRWRQVLAEASRIETKHLLTLEPAISANQTAEMQAKKLQLVLPKKLTSTYSSEQQKWLVDLGDFCHLVSQRQNLTER